MRMNIFLAASYFVSSLYVSHAFTPSFNHLSSIQKGTKTLPTKAKPSSTATPLPFLQRRSFSQSSSTSLSVWKRLCGTCGIELKDLLYDSPSMAIEAWDWTANLGAPAALIAGAVLVTLSETRETTIIQKTDSRWIRSLKKSCRFLLFSSFVFEVISIFVGTMTGSVLLGHGEQLSKAANVGYKTPLSLLKHHHEFEYLTIQITFLQGLIHWILATTCELLIPGDSETKEARLLNKCCASWLISLSIWIMAFYNNHLNFYSDYFTMVCRYIGLFFNRYVWSWRTRPLSALYIPSFVLSLILSWKALIGSPKEETS